MDGTPLDKAYTAAKNGDAAVLSADFKKAASFFKDAADYFDQVRNQSPDNPSSRTLQALAEQYRERCEYFGSGKAAIDSKKQFASPSSSASIGTIPFASTSGPSHGSSRSPTRSVWNDVQTPSSNPSSALSSNGTSGTNLVASTVSPLATPSQAGIVAPIGDAVTSLVMRSAAVFARTFEQSFADRIIPSGLPAGGINAPSESFYLVKPSTEKNNESRSNASAASPNNPSSRISLTNFERTQAIEKASKAQHAALKSGLRQILHDVASREQQMNDEYLEEVDRLRAENDRLKIQVSKLKSRWEDLKESARKRHTNDQ